MPSRLAALSLDVVDVALVAQFWQAVLGGEIVDQDETGVSIGVPHVPGVVLDVLVNPDRKTVKNRLHLDLRADGTSTEQELARLEALGARRVDVGQEADVSWVVLADPEGNEFCLLSRTVQEVDSER